MSVALRLNRRPKASDISDRAMLRAVDRLCCQRDSWTNTTLVAEAFGWMPYKVVQAKLRRLHSRGLVSGCPCGCRGDWEVTSKGRELAGITSSYASTGAYT